MASHRARDPIQIPEPGITLVGAATRQPRPPPTIGGDVLGAGQAVGLADEAGFPAAIGQFHLAQAERGDPPSRVARLSYVRGEVSFSPAGEEDWVNATRNLVDTRTGLLVKVHIYLLVAVAGRKVII